MFFLLYNVTLIYLSSVACFFNTEICDIEIVWAIQKKKIASKGCLFKKKCSLRNNEKLFSASFWNKYDYTRNI